MPTLQTQRVRAHDDFEEKPSVIRAENVIPSEVPNPGSDHYHEDGPPRLHSKTFVAVAAAGLIYFVQLMNLVGVGAQGNIIAEHFGHPSQSTWLTQPITILTVVLGPIVSQAADYWGRKWFLVILTLIGAVASIVISRADSFAMLVAGFTIMGFAYGAQPLLHVVASEVLPRRWRGYGQAADMVSNSFGSVVGLLVGGALNRASNPTSNGFRYYWYMVMACFAAAALLTCLGYNPPKSKTQHQFTHKEKLRKLDWLGYFLLSSSLVLFSIGLSWSRNPYPWSDAHVSATFSIGVVLAAALVAYETFFKDDGMFHHGLFTGNRNFSIALFCVFCEGLAFFSANTYFAFQVNILYETDALLVGLRYSIVLITCMASSVLAGIYSAVSRRVRWVTFTAFIIFVAFFVGMATTSLGSNNVVWGYPVLLGVALGMTLTNLVSVAQLSIPPDLISVASGLIISIRSLGGTIALAIDNALFSEAMGDTGKNIAAAVLPKGLSPDYLGEFITALSNHNDTGLESIPGLTGEVIKLGTEALLQTYVVAFRHVWITAACFVTLAAIGTVFLSDPREEFNMHIDAPMEAEQFESA
ncbi:Siderophore iron transporter [Pleurostoma richardsiae]|uniref:Siderophore iron transporter n=1 Tax=Pleurostoma richardsiae TaxID=41990 RepID=A0AA38RQ25_9PEZI|nr:Siderophore iron transporter [Pleurostoma richardsiae]